MKIRLVNNTEGKLYGYEFLCPGCAQYDEPGSSLHAKHLPDKSWTFNGDVDKPTLSPSVLLTGKYPVADYRCHSFVRDGRIEFLSDCSHALAGKTVELPEVT